MDALQLGDRALEIADVVAVARHNRAVAVFGPAAGDSFVRATASRGWVERAVDQLTQDGEDARAYYGINTGFGFKSGRQPLPPEDIPWVQRNLILSHATGTGQPLSPAVVRAAMLIRAQSLAQGYSGVRPVVINTLVAVLNSGIIPVIPEYGSLGASGDLIPLSHLAQLISTAPEGGERLALPDDYNASGRALVPLTEDMTAGEFRTVLTLDGRRYAETTGERAMALAGIPRLVLDAKEGLALNNGTTFSAALLALAVHDARNLLHHANLGAAMTLEALLGFRDAYLPQIQQVRGHAGQQQVAATILALTEGSTLLDGAADHDPVRVPPQDPYSLRVAPVVHGAMAAALDYIEATVATEINAATDNPLIFDLPDDHPLHLPRSYRAVSGANFHGAPLAYAADLLTIVLTDLGGLSERRIFRLTDPALNRGLPTMLIADPPGKPGRTSGLMMPQYLAAALVSDSKTLAHPDSVDSITTSANQEDHVSMSMNAARHAFRVAGNIETVVAIELLSAAVALRWRVDELQRLLDDPALFESLEGQRKTTVLEAVLHNLQREGAQPRAGAGTSAAMAAIEAALYPPGNALPPLGRGQGAEDRFLQPYVRRMVALLQAGTLRENG